MVCLCARGHLGCFSFGAIMNPTAIFIAVLKLKKDSNDLTKDLLRTGCVSYSFLSPGIWHVCARRHSVNASSVSG